MTRVVLDQEAWYNLNAGISKVIQVILDQRDLTPWKVEKMMHTSAHEVHKALEGRRDWTLYLLWQVCDVLTLNLHAVIREATDGMG